MSGRGASWRRSPYRRIHSRRTGGSGLALSAPRSASLTGSVRAGREKEFPMQNNTDPESTPDAEPTPNTEPT
ncbi:MAG: hypothetical protein ACRDTM_08965, partial [Micromonosporaceae bacterium]